MGLRPSPYLAARFYYWAEEIARGDPCEPDNPFGYDRIIENLPGSAQYNPLHPWIMKWNEVVQQIAAEVICYCDDLRINGYSLENAWAASRRIASRLQHLGIQDAPRKRRPPSQTPGAWIVGDLKFCSSW